MLGSLKFRLTVLAAVWIVVGLGAGGLVLSFVFQRTVESAFDERLEDILVGVVAAAEVRPDGTLALSRQAIDQRFSRVFSGWYWQISDASGVLARSRSLWDQELADSSLRAQAGGGRFTYLSGPREKMLRVFSRNITIPRHDGALTFLVGADVVETEQEVHVFNALLMFSLGLLGAGLVIAIILQVAFGLRPLLRLRGDLEKVRTGTNDRLSNGYPQEIKPLADAMNAVLEQNNEMIKRARAVAGDLAHGLKTPLSILRGEANDLDAEKSARLNKQIDAMSRLVDRYLARSATAGIARFSNKRTEILPVAREIRDGLIRLFAERNLTIVLDIPEELYFQGEKEDLEEMLGNLMENACKWASENVGVTARKEQSALHICVSDDGPGLTEMESKAATERGRRFDERSSGSGLGLAIVNDIAALYQGQLTLERASIGGLEAALELPAAERQI